MGGITRALTTLAARGEGAAAQITADIRDSPMLHADETGWRQNGRTGYAWTFSTPTQRLFVHGGRDRAMLDATLGADYAGVLVSDLYAVYTGYDGRHQYCWAHLLRDVDELAAQHRQDAQVCGWADAVHGLYARATAFGHADPLVRRQQRQGDEAELGALCAPFLGNEAAPQRVLCERIAKHLSALFVFVEDPAVPPTTNAAERSLRHLVTRRKISGGSRSPAGTATTMTLATLFGTWRLQERSPLEACRALLASPQV